MTEDEEIIMLLMEILNIPAEVCLLIIKTLYQFKLLPLKELDVCVLKMQMHHTRLIPPYNLFHSILPNSKISLLTEVNHLVTSLHLVGSPIQTCSATSPIRAPKSTKYIHRRLYGHESTQRSFENFKVAHLQNSQTNSVHGIVLLQGNNGWINICSTSDYSCEHRDRRCDNGFLYRLIFFMWLGYLIANKLMNQNNHMKMERPR
ncbi:CLL_collapsed_G0029330.mRNA.1.CDS.1 [Saccharomyces cerevisiae]|nr:CLL_collapsed_G0029330.mRNA.1.CDS.1 [Saccharomyces cerevisiae]